MLKIGLLGCGRIGQVHARSIAQLDSAHLTAVADASPAAAQAVAVRSGAKVATAEDILADPNVDAVIVATPTDTHYDLIHAAARAGKAIFCEKPVDMSAARIRECIVAVEDAKVAFMTAFNRRFDTGFAQLQARIRAGEIGQVELVIITSRDPAPPPIEYIRRSGGIFRDMMIHDFDMARFLLGEEPLGVFAVGEALVDPAIGAAGDVDTAAVTLTTASGAICQITNSRRAVYGYDQRIEVHGARGMLQAGNVLENTVVVASEAGFRTAATQAFFLERYEMAYRMELEHFVHAALDGFAPSPGIADGLAAQLMAEAADQSLKTGQPVSL